jgi:ribosomal protein S1
MMAAAALLSPLAVADIVTLRSGKTVEGEVVSVDDRHVVVRTDRSNLRLSRSEVASIDFTDTARPLKVEIRNVRADDYLDVLVEDEVVIRDARNEGSWIDITSKLKDGNNALTFRIRNDRNTWGYIVHVRINGKVTKLACGNPPDTNQPCRCCGKTGTERGIIDDLPPVWIHFDSGLGEAEVIR